MRLYIPACLLAFMLVGCGTVRPTTSFDASNTGSFALIVTDGLGESTPTFYLQKVNLESSTFLPDYSMITFNPLLGNELKKPDTMKNNTRFGGTAVAAGEYAIVSKLDRDFNCFSLGAPVYRLKPGAIQIVSLTNIRGNEAAKSPELVTPLVDSLIPTYPNMTAPVSPAEFIGVITFELAKRRFGKRPCTPAGPFSMAQ